MAIGIPRWSDSTREERYFTARLFGELINDPAPFWDLLRPRLNISDQVQVEDQGYEVCMLRDLAFAGVIDRYKDLEKQTFDLVLTLSNNDLVLIEAKAHEPFSLAQLQNAAETHNRLRKDGVHVVNNVHMAGLHSSKYDPRNVRAKYPSMAMLTWAELARSYSGAEQDLMRADEIYGNRASAFLELSR